MGSNLSIFGVKDVCILMVFEQSQTLRSLNWVGSITNAIFIHKYYAMYTIYRQNSFTDAFLCSFTLSFSLDSSSLYLSLSLFLSFSVYVFIINTYNTLSSAWHIYNLQHYGFTTKSQTSVTLCCL